GRAAGRPRVASRRAGNGSGSGAEPVACGASREPSGCLSGPLSASCRQTGYDRRSGWNREARVGAMDHDGGGILASLARVSVALATRPGVAPAGSTAGAPAPPATPGRPALVVFVSVDQMHVEYLSRFASLYQGGLKRIDAEAAVFTNALYRHANTETGPGHAA